MRASSSAPGAGRRLHQQLVGGLAVVEDLAGQAVEHHQPQREQIGASVDVDAARLLGRHEADVPLDDAVLGLRDPPLGLHDAEVEQLHLAARRDQDVAGRDVAVDDAHRAGPPSPSLVCAYSSARSVSAGRVQHQRRRQRRAAAARCARAARRPRSRPRMYSCARKYSSPTLPKSNTGMMLECTSVEPEVRLVDELRDDGRLARQLGAQPLDHERAAEPLGAEGHRREHLGHPAFAEQVEQPVAPEADGPDAVGGRGGRRRAGAPRWLPRPSPVCGARCGRAGPGAPVRGPAGCGSAAAGAACRRRPRRRASSPVAPDERRAGGLRAAQARRTARRAPAGRPPPRCRRRARRRCSPPRARRRRRSRTSTATAPAPAG